MSTYICDTDCLPVFPLNFRKRVVVCLRDGDIGDRVVGRVLDLILILGESFKFSLGWNCW